MLGGGPEPVDLAMYNRIKARVKKEWQKKSRWPSAYGSAHLVKEYKKEFKKKNGNKNPYKGNRSTKKSKVKSKVKKKIDCRLKNNKSKVGCKKKMSGGKVDCRLKNNKSKIGCKKKMSDGKIDCRLKNNKSKVRCKSKKEKSKKWKNSSNGLTRWFEEKWVNVCKKKKDGSYATCGRKKSSLKNYPYCRPLHRINKKTPMTVGEMVKKYGKKKIDVMCNKKNNKKIVKSNTYM